MRNHNCSRPFATTKCLLKFERVLFNGYRLASKSFSHHAELWGSLALAKLAKVRIYKSLLTCMEEHPGTFSISRPVTGTFVNLYVKLCSTMEQVQQFQLSENDFLNITLIAESILDKQKVAPVVSCCQVRMVGVISTLNCIQKRQVRLLEGFLYQTFETL